MKLRLHGTHVNTLELAQMESERSVDQSPADGFKTNYWFPKDEPTIFYVVFEIEVFLGKSTLLKLEYHAEFACDEGIDHKFQESPFVGVNAPAIAYPYMRAFITTFCALSGYEPVILPAVNFQALYNKRKFEDDGEEQTEQK